MKLKAAMLNSDTIARFGIDYELGDLLTALRWVGARRPPAMQPREILPQGSGPSATFWTGSGRQALQLILQALKLPAGAKVAVPLYCDASVFRAILRAGCTPVFVDVAEETLTIDPQSLADRRAGLSAVVVPHFFGHVAEIGSILEIAGEIPVIEDVAHAPLATYHDRAVGTFGVAAFYSLGSSKPVPAGGGGIAVANDSALAQLLASEVSSLVKPNFVAGLWNLGAQAAKAIVFRRPYYGTVGRMLRPWSERHQLLEPEMNSFSIQPHQAAIALRQMLRVEKVAAAQRRNSLLLLSLLAGMDETILPTEPAGVRYSFHQFPVVLPSPEAKKLVAREMLRRHVDTSQMYADITEQARRLGYQGDCPVSESVAERMITLPNHAFLSERDVARIADSFRESVIASRALLSKQPVLAPRAAPQPTATLTK